MMKEVNSKRVIKSLSILMTAVLLITGCQTKGLVNYQEAVRTTNSITSGQVSTEVELKTVFNKAGLTIEEEKELSPFENIYARVITKYEESEEPKLEMNIYYIIGAFGIDMSLFFTDDDFIMQIPMINMYLKLDEEDMKDYNDVEVQNEAIEAIFELDFERIMTSWLEVFSEENVIVGKDTYVVTDEGKIKTTTYDFHLTQEQIDRLMELLLEQYDLDELNQFIRIYAEQSGSELSDEELESIDINKWLEKIDLISIQGKAYVDFDNRLIKQEFSLVGEGTDKSPGTLEEFEINVMMTYNNLGEDQVFDFPVLNDENTVDLDGLNEIFDSFDY